MATRDLAAIERALDRPDPDTRCYLLYGTDEATSRALAARLATALGPDAERVDLTPAQLKADPALLADEAASASLFGGVRHIRVDGVGEDCLAAVEALLDAPAAGNPVVLIGTTTLRKDGKLAKRVAADPRARVHISYETGADDAVRIAVERGRASGLRLDGSVARRLAAACNNDRALIAQEIEKLALFADATSEAPQELGHVMLDAIGIDAGELDMARLLDALFGGDVERLDREIAHAAADGQQGIPLIRAILRRAFPMAAIRAEMDRGATAEAALETAGRAIFWRDRKTVARDLPRWTASRIAALIDRLSTLERDLKASAGPGDVAADHLLFAVARSTHRR